MDGQLVARLPFSLNHSARKRLYTRGADRERLLIVVAIDLHLERDTLFNGCLGKPKNLLLALVPATELAQNIDAFEAIKHVALGGAFV